MRPSRMFWSIWAAITVWLCGVSGGPAHAGPVFVTGAGAGGGPHVQVFDATTGGLIFGFFAYAPAFTGGVRVSATDVNGDGVPDVITAPGPGGGPHVRVFDGAALQAGQVVEIVGLFAYNPAFHGGRLHRGGHRNRVPAEQHGAIGADVPRQGRGERVGGAAG